MKPTRQPASPSVSARIPAIALSKLREEAAFLDSLLVLFIIEADVFEPGFFRFRLRFRRCRLAREAVMVMMMPRAR